MREAGDSCGRGGFGLGQLDSHPTASFPSRRLLQTQMSDYPAPKYLLFLSYLLRRLGYEFLPKSIQDKAQGIPDLIAEVSEAQDLRDGQVQVASWEGVEVGSMYWWQLQGSPRLRPTTRGHCPLPSPRLTQGPMGAQGEPQSICPTLGDPRREVLSLQRERRGVAAAYEAAGPEGRLHRELVAMN